MSNMSEFNARRARVSARVRIIAADGAHVQVEHVLTGRRFTLDVGAADQARELAAHREVDITAEVSKIGDVWTSGKLVRWHALDNVDPGEAWRAWFAPSAERWRRLSEDDIRRELGRDE